MRGRTVLDVGTWDGFFAFECERRGAEVVATDSYVWDVISRAGFDAAHQALHSKVRAEYLPVLEHSPSRIGIYDTVLFLGVLYHMRHPLLSLEAVASVCSRLLILETHIGSQSVPYPAMTFYPTNELAGDSTNWWGPNSACVTAMLRDVGFQEVYESFPPYGGHQDRRVFHAYKI
jgi:tRNA (mo5U34)-methyltransferase